MIISIGFAAVESVGAPAFGDRITPRKTFSSEFDKHFSGGNVPVVARINSRAASSGNSNKFAVLAVSSLGGGEVKKQPHQSEVILTKTVEQKENGQDQHAIKQSLSAGTEVNQIDSLNAIRNFTDAENDVEETTKSANHVQVNVEINKSENKNSSMANHMKIGQVESLSQYQVNENLNLSDPRLRNDSRYTSAEAHRLEMSTEFFEVPSTPKTRLPASVVGQIARRSTIRPAASNFSTTKGISPNTLDVPSSSNRSRSWTSNGLRNEPWAVSILVLACGCMMLIVVFELFVLFKAWRSTPSRRHLFLGQMLLLGLFSCSGLAAVLTMSPTVVTCSLMRFGTGIAFALVFASLLVKCLFLISMNSGVYLPAAYQGLLLLFAVLIQVAIGVQWLITTPSQVENVTVPITATTPISSRYHWLLTANDVVAMTPTIPLCDTSFSDLLCSLVYVVFLIVFVTVLAFKSRGIRDNYREATYIGLAIGGAVPIWLGWTLTGLAVTERHRDACLAFGLVATSATIFLVMFLPKGRQLAAMGKEGLYIEDREERFSSLSRTGSGYSPSFFHFKPLKYGVMGHSQSPTPNTDTGVGPSPKQQAVASLGAGEFSVYSCSYESFPIQSVLKI